MFKYYPLSEYKVCRRKFSTSLDQALAMRILRCQACCLELLQMLLSCFQSDHEFGDHRCTPLYPALWVTETRTQVLTPASTVLTKPAISWAENHDFFSREILCDCLFIVVLKLAMQKSQGEARIFRELCQHEELLSIYNA